MKKYILLLFSAITMMISCARSDHDAILEQLRDHEERIQALEAQCRQLNSNVEAIQTILKALEQNDYITDITKITEAGIEIGYSITFAKGGTINIYHGSNGADGAAPKIGIKKAQDGEYYWTADEEWLTDENGEMIPAVVPDDAGEEYVTPQFRVAEGVWYVSFDNGNTWRLVETDGGTFFSDVRYDNEFLFITLSDGTELKIARCSDGPVVDLFIFMGQSNMVGRGVAADAPKVPEGWGYEYKAISQPGKLLPVVEPFGLDEENSASGVVDNRRSGSLVSAFMNSYYENTGTPVVGVSCSKGGTTTTFWKPGGKPLNDAISRYQQAEEWLLDNGYSIGKRYMFWLQGETDATNNMSAETYRSNMIGIVKEMISKTSVEKCMMIRVGKLGQTVTSAFTICDDIIEVQTDLCRTYKEFVMASTAAAGFVEDGLMAEYWHYTQEGYNLLGTYTGQNVAFYAKNNIEPYMYDPHHDDLYYPFNKHMSIFDGEEEDEEIVEPDYDFSNTTWYVNHTKNGARFTNSCNVDGRGWTISENNSVYAHIIGKPINTVAFFTNKQSQTVTVMKVPYKGATSGEVIATVTATIPSATKQLAVINFPAVTLAEGEYLSLFSQEDNGIQFYYASTGINDSATGALDKNFYSRLPVVYGSGTTWSEASMCLGWSLGYTALDSYSALSFACIGDSITAGSGTTKTYWQILEETLGLESMTGMGVPGSCISSKSDYSTSNSPLINRYTSIPDSDIITIFMGTNDYGHETPLGTITDKTDISFYGALNVIIPGIIKANPCSRVIFMTPIHRYGFGTSKLTGTDFTYDHLPNGLGYTLQDYADAIKAVCTRYSVPVIDMFEAVDLDPSISSVKSTYMPDGLHPNAAGHEIIAAAIRKYMEDNHMDEYTLTYGNDYNSEYMDSNTRVSVQPYSIYVPEGVTITPKSGYKWGWFTDVDPSAMPSGQLGSAWTTGAYTGTGTAIGITIMKEDESAFDLGGTDSICISDYLIASDPSIWTINGRGNEASGPEKTRKHASKMLYM